MGAATGEETKALRIAATDDGASASTQASVPPAEQQRRRPASLPAAGVAASAGGGSAAAQSRGEEEEDEDEKVERFYALLANIRALRSLCTAGESGSSPAGGRGRKRARGAEGPWRPAFRMEDFAEEEVSQEVVAGDAPCAVKKQQQGAGVARRPGVATARAAADGREEDEVPEEARGMKLGRRVAAQG
ncbi:unnamed protein product [Urochloa decumbens]|uniref:Uncharacterized protein n=1 Tax=Urochloa decumbens TaxID=240449 RepID=A0ABC9GHQ2_9POAL